MAKRKGHRITVGECWEDLTYKERELLTDVMGHSKYRRMGMSMGKLALIPTAEVIFAMRQVHLSYCIGLRAKLMILQQEKSRERKKGTNHV